MDPGPVVQLGLDHDLARQDDDHYHHLDQADDHDHYDYQGA